VVRLKTCGAMRPANIPRTRGRAKSTEEFGEPARARGAARKVRRGSEREHEQRQQIERDAGDSSLAVAASADCERGHQKRHDLMTSAVREPRRSRNTATN